MNWIYLLLIASGFSPLLVVLYKMSKMNRWRSTGIATTATVTKIPLGFYNRLTTVTIQYFVKETGQVIEKEITTAGNNYARGQQLPLLYKKDKPGDFILDSGKSYTLILLFAIILAVGMLIATILIRYAVTEGLM